MVRWDLQLSKLSGCKPGLDEILIAVLSHAHTHKSVNQNPYYSAQKKKDKVQHCANAAVWEKISFICICICSHALSNGKKIRVHNISL